MIVNGGTRTPEVHLYELPLDGGQPRRLTKTPGVHTWSYGEKGELHVVHLESSTGSGPYEVRRILKTEYLNIANRVLSYINTYNKAPTYAVSSKGNIRFTSLIYMYSKIMAYYYTNGRLPGYVSVAHWTYLPMVK